MVVNPNNWHWVDKNCIDWAREYFKSKLVQLNTGEHDGKYAEIKSILSIEGDCEVNQRKGKVISLFDLKIAMLIGGHVNKDEFEGSIVVPEVAFDSNIDDYQFEISIYKETSKLNEVKPVIREYLLSQLRSIFHQFGKDLLFEHGNDIQVPEEQVQSQYTKANQQNSFADVSSTTGSKKTATTVNKSIPVKDISSSKAVVKTLDNKDIPIVNTGGANTVTIHLEPSFNVPAVEIFNTFIDKERIMMWSRSPIREFDENKSTGSQYFMVGDRFELFNGNIESEVVESKLGSKLVLKWRLKDWRENLYSTMDMEFHESSEYHETKIQLTWSGIPVGEEDRVRANFEDYYVKPIKLTFGFGVVL
ncbi:Aha1p PWA37_000156 [Arxiozyma heterogenica]|uniref:Activator of Hsp90 ATPase AHSA1-like N-terminal domain-containing protein n=1 Tax=Arxiozyma heterogenica TaxID=278026 RepID=A0AAN7W040_9SACH|nr:hypothetical protein RI543_004247 [Kazachstania heterogenica]